MKNPWTVIGIITVVLFGGAFWYASVSAEKNNEGIEIMSHIKGNPESTVTLVEYSDFQCPACAAFQPALNDVLEKHGEQIKFEYKHFPLPIHSFAIQASVAAEAAGQQGKFFEYHDILFAEQANWASSATPQSLFIQYAERLELDIEMFKRHMNASVLRDHVKGQFDEGRGLGITGTPTFFLNGERMQIKTYEDFLNQVEAAASGEVPSPAADDASEVRFAI